MLTSGRGRPQLSSRRWRCSHSRRVASAGTWARTEAGAAHCTVSGNVVEATGLPSDVVLNFMMSDADGWYGWGLGYTWDGTGAWSVTVPDRTGPTTYEFASTTFGKAGQQALGLTRSRSPPRGSARGEMPGSPGLSQPATILKPSRCGPRAVARGIGADQAGAAACDRAASCCRSGRRTCARLAPAGESIAKRPTSGSGCSGALCGSSDSASCSGRRPDGRARRASSLTRTRAGSAARADSRAAPAARAATGVSARLRRLTANTLADRRRLSNTGAVLSGGV